MRYQNGSAFRMALEVGTGTLTLGDGVAIAEALLNPLLDGSAKGAWSPGRREWG